MNGENEESDESKGKMCSKEMKLKKLQTNTTGEEKENRGKEIEVWQMEQRQ